VKRNAGNLMKNQTRTCEEVRMWGSVRSQEVQVQVEATEVPPAMRWETHVR